MRSILAPLRVFGVFLIVVTFLLHMSCVWFIIRDRWRRLRWSNSFLQHYARVACFVLGLRVNPIGLENLRDVKSGLYVGNHLSYTDVLAISSVVPACYVTSQEIRQTPLLGQICLLAGCLFVERRNKMNIRNEVSEIRRGLNLGLNITIFPEATSTNGEQVLRFRKPLFLSGIDAGTTVVPFCLNYRTVGGEPVVLANRDNVFWYGDMDFVPHLWRLARSGGVGLDLHFLKPIKTNPDMDATSLAEQSQAEVESVFRPIKKDEGPGGEPSSAGLREV